MDYQGAAGRTALSRWRSFGVVLAALVIATMPLTAFAWPAWNPHPPGSWVQYGTTYFNCDGGVSYCQNFADQQQSYVNSEKAKCNASGQDCYSNYYRNYYTSWGQKRLNIAWEEDVRVSGDPCKDGGTWTNGTSTSDPGQCKYDGGGNRGGGACEIGIPKVSDPIDVATGNNYRTVNLFSTGPVQIALSYNSSAKRWTQTFDWALIFDAASGGYWLHRGDGMVKLFAKVSNTLWQASGLTDSQLVKLSDGTFDYATATADYKFSASGQLTEIDWRSGAVKAIRSSNEFDLTRAGQAIATATINSHGDITQVSYGSHTIALTYDSNALLSTIARDGTTTRTFLYGDSSRPYLLTGVDDAQGQQIASWTYDDQGRVTQAQDGGGVGNTKLQFNSDGSVTVTNPLGKQSTYRFADIAGAKRATSVTGQPSQHCAAADKSTTYYPSGLPKVRTDWKGNITAYTYNSRGLETGRIEAEGTPQERTITTQWDSRFPLPTRITNPDQVITITYDAQGHLLSRTVSPK